MPQCEKYPNKCQGLVVCDKVDGKWYCTKHFSELGHLRDTGRHK